MRPGKPLKKLNRNRSKKREFTEEEETKIRIK